MILDSVCIKEKSMLKTLVQTYSIIGLFVFIVGELSLPTAYAQSVPWNEIGPEGSQASDVPIGPVRPTLSFQAIIVRDELPIIEGKIAKLTVQISNSSNATCEELFTDVFVRDSVINLELGTHSNCILDAYMNSEQNTIKLCYEHDQNNTPTQCFGASYTNIGAVPSAIKVRETERAQVAYQADWALTSHYVYPYLSVSGQPGTHFVFTAPKDLDSISDKDLYKKVTDASTSADYITKGYLTWATIENPSNASLTFKSGDRAQGKLDEIIIDARTSDWLSPVTVENKLTTTGNTTVKSGSLRTQGPLTVTTEGVELVQGNMVVEDPTTLIGRVVITEGLSQQALASNFTVGEVNIKGDLHVATSGAAVQFGNAGGSTVTNRIVGDSQIALEGDQGVVNVGETLSVRSGLSVQAGRVKFSNDLKLMNGSDLTVDGRVHTRSIKLNSSGVDPKTVLATSGLDLKVNDNSYNNIIFENDVEFRGEVEITNPNFNRQDSEAECTITRVKEWVTVKINGEDTPQETNKFLEGVMSVTCDGQVVLVSSILESICGDGKIDQGEACDSSENVPLIALDSYCQTEPSEQFDVNLGDSSSWCRQPCNNVELGDFPDIETAIAACETRRYAQTRCRTTCQVVGCGDGVVDAKERCDDGNDNPADGCDTSCRFVSECDLGVRRKIVQKSEVVLVDTSISINDRELINTDLDLKKSEYYEHTGIKTISDTECTRSDGTRYEGQITLPTNVGAQVVLEVDVERRSRVIFEALNPRASSPANSYVPYLFLREECGFTESLHCEKSTGDFNAIIGKQDNVEQGIELDPGAYFLVVGGEVSSEANVESSGITDVAVRFVCDDSAKLVKTVKVTEEDQTESFDITIDSSRGRPGAVNEECITKVNKETYGSKQVAIEVILAHKKRVALKVFNRNGALAPVIYIKETCEGDSLLPTDADSSDLNCDDNTTIQTSDNVTIPGAAQINQEFDPGVYYFIIDQDSNTDGGPNLSAELRIYNPSVAE